MLIDLGCDKVNNSNINTKVFSSLIWKFLERIGTQGIQFFVSILLARFLLPSDYGVVSMILVFIAVANVFVQTGFNTSLIQKKNVDELDFSSIFFVSFAIASISYILLFVAAPFIADFYNMPETKILRLLALTLFFGAINSIQEAKISKTLKFKKLFLSSIGAIICSGSTGVIMALNGYGAWALVGQQLVNSIVTCVILWFTSGWKPKLMFSFKRVKELFSFGWKVLCSSLLDTIYLNLYNLVIGKIFDSKTLGVYNKGEQFPKLIKTNVDGAIASVMLPVYAEKQEDKLKVKKMVKRSITTSAFIMFPMMFGLAAVAEPIVVILLTDKWLECVPFMQIMCFVYVFYPISTANLQALKALGRSDLFLKAEILKKILGIITLIITIPFGVYAMALAQIFVSIISTYINARPNHKLLDYKYFEQVKDVIPSFFISLLMGIIVYLFNFLSLNIYIKLFVEVLFGILFYLGVSWLLKIESFDYMLKMLKEFISKKEKRENM